MNEPTIITLVIGETQPDADNMLYDPAWLEVELPEWITTGGGSVGWGFDVTPSIGRAFSVRSGPPGCAVVTAEVYLDPAQREAIEAETIRCGLCILHARVVAIEGQRGVGRLTEGTIMRVGLSPDGIDGPVALGERD